MEHSNKSPGSNQARKKAQHIANSQPSVCFEFRRSGNCKLGELCKYRHVGVAKPAKESSNQPEHVQRSRKTTPHHQSLGNPNTTYQRTPKQNSRKLPPTGTSTTDPRLHGRVTPHQLTVDLARLSNALTLNPDTPSSVVKNMAEGSVSVTFGPGVDIAHLASITSSSSTIVLKNLPLGITTANITEFIRACTVGKNIPSQFIRVEQDDTNSQASIRLRTPAEAVELTTTLDKAQYGAAVLECNLLDASITRTDNVVIYCGWFLPACMAYVSFINPDGVDSAEMSPQIHGTRARARRMEPKVFRGVLQHSIQIFDLPTDTTESDLRAAYPSALRIEIKAPRYKGPQFEVVAIIRSLFEKHAGSKVEFKVVTSPSKKRQSAMVTFDDFTMAQELFKDLRDQKLQCLGGDSLQLTIKFTSKLRIDNSVFNRIEEEVMKLESKDLCLKIWSRGRCSVAIDLSGSDRDVVAKAKSTILKLMRGSLVEDENGQPLWDPVLNFSDARQSLIAAATGSNVHLFINVRNRTVTIYGSPEACQAARDPLIKAYGVLLKSRLQPIHLSLHHGVEAGSESQQHAIDECIDSVLQRHSRNRVTISKEEGRTKITVRCSKADIPTLFTIHRIFRHRISNQATNSAIDCVTCFCDADDPVITSCGHRYCKSCYQNLIRSVIDTRKFPILCFGPKDPAKAGSDSTTCDTPFDLNLIQRILTTTEFNSLLETSLTSYIQARPEQFYYCPTPDCNSILPAVTKAPAGVASNPSSSPKTRTCAKCFITSCPSCRTESHVGKSCEENKLTDDDKARLWKEKTNTKDCPNCGAWTEKNNGCNHMTCVVCKGHWCWSCGTKQDAATIYQHIADCTGPPPQIQAVRNPAAPAPRAQVEHMEWRWMPEWENAYQGAREEQEAELLRRWRQEETAARARREREEDQRRLVAFYQRQHETRRREQEERERAQQARESQTSGWGCSIM